LQYLTSSWPTTKPAGAKESVSRKQLCRPETEAG
jgi:hypothetical protein